jgi:hypothetical protein
MALPGVQWRDGRTEGIAPAETAPFDQLDFIYSPSRDVASEAAHLVTVLGARLVFAIDAMGTRVAMLELTDGPPHLLLTDHLDGERPILIYRVASLDESLRRLKASGFEQGATLEIPVGPCCSFRTPGGHRFAIYEPTRPEVAQHFEGRRDF